MIKERPMFGVVCDNCKEQFIEEEGFAYWHDPFEATESAENHDWYIGKIKDTADYCDLCHSFDDDDNLIINADRKK